MSGLGAETFEIYGGDILNMLQGRIAARGSDFGIGAPETVLEVPSFETEGRHWLSMPIRGTGIRKSFPAGMTSLGFWLEFHVPSMPGQDNRLWLLQLRDGSNAAVATIRVNTDGSLSVSNSANLVVASSAGPVIISGTTMRMQAEFTLNNGAGTVEIRLNGVAAPVVSATGLVLGGTAAQFFIGVNDTSFGPHASWYAKAFAPYIRTGTYNNSWPSISGVDTLMPDQDLALQGFRAYPRQKIQAGILNVPGNGSLLDCAAAADYDLGAADYTMESWFRFAAAVPGSEAQTILGKWSASTNRRSYRLVKYGPTLNNGKLQFEITTDGTLATLQTILSVAYDFNVGEWYNICVQRSAGTTSIFINGVRLAPAVVDAYTYYAAGIFAKFCLGGEMSGTATTVLANSSVTGMFDETRITPGVARYGANYTPTAVPYPRSSPTDPNFANVVFLAGYDSGLVDESAAPHTLAARGTAAQLVPNDGSFAYQTINGPGPLDDRYVAAALVAATGILTVTALPANGNTVTVGASVYTFNTVLGGAGSVLIGVDVAACLENLANAINGGPGAGTTYGAATAVNASAQATIAPSSVQLTATAITPGAAGNAIATTETLPSGAWTNTTLTGGANIAGPSEFSLEPLSPKVTGVRWIELIDRSFVNLGAATLRKSFAIGASVTAGIDNALTTTPTYRGDTFEQDPATAGALTPSSVNNGALRLTRVS